MEVVKKGGFFMMNLSKKEKCYLKLFLEDNLEWIKVNSMTKEENLYSLIELYGSFLEDNHLSYARNLQMFLVLSQSLFQNLLVMSISSGLPLFV